MLHRYFRIFYVNIGVIWKIKIFLIKNKNLPFWSTCLLFFINWLGSLVQFWIEIIKIGIHALIRISEGSIQFIIFKYYVNSRLICRSFDQIEYVLIIQDNLIISWFQCQETLALITFAITLLPCKVKYSQGVSIVGDRYPAYHNMLLANTSI